MESPLITLDRYLLKHFQEFSEHIQVTADKNCYYLAYESYRFDHLLSRLIPGFLAICHVLITGNMILLLVPAYFLILGFAYRHQHLVMLHVSRQTKKIPEPSEFLRYHSVIIGSLIFGINLYLGYLLWQLPFALAYFVCMALSQFCAVSTVYFLSCTPLPPETLEFRRNAKQSTKRSRAFKPQTV